MFLGLKFSKNGVFKCDFVIFYVMKQENGSQRKNRSVGLFIFLTNRMKKSVKKIFCHS